MSIEISASDVGTQPSAPQGARESAPRSEERIPWFGARKRARALALEVTQLRATLDQLGALSLAEIESRRAAAVAELAAQETELEVQRVRASTELALEREGAQAEIARARQEALDERSRVTHKLAELKAEVVVTEDEILLQEAGVYRYRHPLSDSVAYKAELERLRDRIKTMTRKDGGAVLATTHWTVNGSVREGRTMVRDFSKLLLRAYNAEADNVVRGLKPYKLDSAIDRLTKVTSTIEKLGRTMDIRIAADYHALRILELELTADYVDKVAQEKEHEREERERLREERRAQQEMEREKARLEKERKHYETALEALMSSGDEEGATRMRARLADVDRAIEDVDYRAANIRAGYVYVISNIGSFGEKMVKIGMTRRLEPLDRVRELGDASVPFRYDVHALSSRRTPSGSRRPCMSAWRTAASTGSTNGGSSSGRPLPRLLLEPAGDSLQYAEVAEALEYRRSAAAASSVAG
jgi:hypothetical protein